MCTRNRDNICADIIIRKAVKNISDPDFLINKRLKETKEIIKCDPKIIGMYFDPEKNEILFKDEHIYKKLYKYLEM